MNELIAKLLKLKTPAKVGACIGAAVAICGLYYVAFYQDVDEGITRAKAAQEAAKQERESYEKRKTEYLAYRNELTLLQEKQREILRALPKEQEIPSFISSIQEQAELAGLEVLTLNIDDELPEPLYIKIPVKMEVRGSYHAITKFFKSVSELRRIVNVEELAMSPERTVSEAESDAPVKLRARFIAATFRYREGKGS
ncbi:MAG: type 4a pilus biogenesis protein PilO [Deltaproteobacteria bacterium]|nr:type 4a pilus biogenesis protein PilO [Deltaproteobacteria bacterium]